MERKNTDPNNDPHYCRPTAWRRMKDAYKPTDQMHELFVAIEQVGLHVTGPREMLKACMWHFLTQMELIRRLAFKPVLLDPHPAAADDLGV